MRLHSSKDLIWTEMERWASMNCESCLMAMQLVDEDSVLYCKYSSHSHGACDCHLRLVMTFRMFSQKTLKSSRKFDLPHSFQVASDHWCSSNPSPRIIWSHWHQFWWTLWQIAGLNSMIFMFWFYCMVYSLAQIRYPRKHWLWRVPQVDVQPACWHQGRINVEGTGLVVCFDSLEC